MTKVNNLRKNEVKSDYFEGHKCRQTVAENPKDGYQLTQKSHCHPSQICRWFETLLAILKSLKVERCFCLY